MTSHDTCQRGEQAGISHVKQGLGDGMPVMTLEKWSWFLVQVQNEERLLAFKQLKGVAPHLPFESF